MGNTRSEQPDPVQKTTAEIQDEVERLKREAEGMRGKHQFFTVATILLGVAAPALVTYSTNGNDQVWKLCAIVITAIASASATIRTVLRYGDRFSNSSMTALALEDLSAQLNTKREQVLIEVKDEFHPQKMFEFAAWGRKELYAIKKAYVEKEVVATTKEKLELSEPPHIEQNQKIDPTKKVIGGGYAQSSSPGT
ncbi:DUF4231 domain-containing protein [Paraburkholderia terrae]|uniref:DUF4231 domain-containing protein n=1 Tax=Paraburkholderia terrae TaxID=311230 RepID=UPI00205489F7|nr:DUF4231 domain-containing protein [Paraburkholderia terrae]BDC46007.1 hypothetical protein PTKU15_93040 [Paraburkholderia terrae]